MQWTACFHVGPLIKATLLNLCSKLMKLILTNLPPSKHNEVLGPCKCPFVCSMPQTSLKKMAPSLCPEYFRVNRTWAASKRGKKLLHTNNSCCHGMQEELSRAVTKTNVLLQFQDDRSPTTKIFAFPSHLARFWCISIFHSLCPLSREALLDAHLWAKSAFLVLARICPNSLPLTVPEIFYYISVMIFDKDQSDSGHSLPHVVDKLRRLRNHHL